MQKFFDAFLFGPCYSLIVIHLCPFYSGLCPESSDDNVVGSFNFYSCMCDIHEPLDQ